MLRLSFSLFLLQPTYCASSLSHPRHRSIRIIKQHTLNVMLASRLIHKQELNNAYGKSRWTVLRHVLLSKTAQSVFRIMALLWKSTFVFVTAYIYIYIYIDWLRARRSGIESRWGRDFPPVQTGPGAHPTSYTMGTRFFPRVKCGRGLLLTTHTLLVPRSWKSRAKPLPILWVRPDL